MGTYKRANITSKTGLNFVRTIVEDAGSLFHRIEQENDLGIDGLIEFVRDGHVRVPAEKHNKTKIGFVWFGGSNRLR